MKSNPSALHQECISWWRANQRAAKSAILNHAHLGVGKDNKLRLKAIEDYLPKGTRQFLGNMKFPVQRFYEQLRDNVRCKFCKLPCAKDQGICTHCIHSPAGKELRSSSISKQFKETWASHSEAERQAREEKKRQTSLLRYGHTHPMGSDEVKETQRKTIRARYGVDAPMQSKKVRDKLELNLLRKHGVYNVSQLQEVKQKKQDTCMRNHGVPYPQMNSEIRKKSSQTLFHNYGVSKGPAESSLIRQKMQATCQERYGFPHPHQNEEIFLKSQLSGHLVRYVTDVYTGEPLAMRGYEPQAYEVLVKKYKRRLQVGAKGHNLTYHHKGKTCRFFPDFSVKRKDGSFMYFEVKSTYTLLRDLPINRKKAKIQNVHFILVRPDNNLSVTMLPAEWHSFSTKQLKELLA